MMKWSILRVRLDRSQVWSVMIGEWSRLVEWVHSHPYLIH